MRKIIIVFLFAFILCGCQTNGVKDVRYEEGIWGNKDWDSIEHALEENCVTDRQTALAIAKVYLETFQRQGFFQNYKEQLVFFDTDDSLWIVVFYEEKDCPGSDFSVAIRQENGEVVKMWVGE